MEILMKKKGYTGKEWKDKATSGKDKHRIYVTGPNGELGYFDMKSGSFINSPKSDITFGVTKEENAKLSLESKSGFNVHLGEVEEEIPDSNDARELLKNAVEKFGSIKKDGSKVEINLGPTIELRLNGRSHWAKANVTVAVDNSENVEELYDIVSDMACAMLDLEIERLSQR